VHREIAAVRHLPDLPKSPITLCGPGTYQPTKEKKLKALECYLQLVKHLLPKNQSIGTSHLWHGDLHVANVFVNPSKPTEIVGIIDWQSTELAPLYFQARQPQFLDFEGPQVEGLERPRLPKDIESMEESEQKRRRKLHVDQMLSFMYTTIVKHRMPLLYSAMEFQQTLSFLLLLLPRNMLIDGEASYLAQLVELEAIWETLPGSKGVPYPFSFSEEERIIIKTDSNGVSEGMAAMRGVQKAIGDLAPQQGLVKTESYDEALDALQQMRDQVIEQYAMNEDEAEIWRKAWPFGT
jgi:hypothetical protein